MDEIDVLADIGVTEYHPDAPEPLSGTITAPFPDCGNQYLLEWVHSLDRTLPEGVACRSMKRGPDGIWREVRRFNELAYETVGVKATSDGRVKLVRKANKAVIDSEAA